ncbi:hypothetical protein MTsPCn5_03220 [Croceitalea sp. MTPC5]|uniref:DUF6503 family protein n=1 Tax=Croceitalea sp. MTPC5 TaxID=3056565 RepID=UPI002B38E3AF|nr:hypothetical protein MTsPCn5_03220 [Croceitalea sp. MTPC5]
MKISLVGVLFLVLSGCAKIAKQPMVDEIVNKSIEVSGGQLYKEKGTSFSFRNKKYLSKVTNGKKILQRITYTDSLKITDVKTNSGFQRFFNDSLLILSDSMANRYANSVNSVHYFARLPFGLNDPAVNRELLGETNLKGKTYYKVKVTFDTEGGGDDFDDVYIYWFNKETFKPDFLAYEFHVDGGGIRFREAFNERYVNGIRFVDYNNYKPKTKDADIYEIDGLFEEKELEMLSKIELAEIEVN